MFRNSAIVPALLVLLTYSPGCKEDVPPANEPGEFSEPCIEGALADTPDGCVDGLECFQGYCEETCTQDSDCTPIPGWKHSCLAGGCVIPCSDVDPCPADVLATPLECGVLGWCAAKDDP